MAGFLNAIGAWFEKITGGWIFGTPLSKFKLTKNVEIEGTDDLLYTHEFQNKDGILAHIEDIELLQGIAFSATYNEASLLVQNSELQIGKWYLIQDFQTIHLIPNTSDINTGSLEPLLILATSLTTFAPRAYSVNFPTDFIDYDFNNILAEDNVTPRKGWINKRVDQVRNIETPYDFRNVKSRRYPVLTREVEAPTQLTPSTFDVLLIFSPNMTASYLTIPRLWQIDFPVGTTNNAGLIDLTIRKGAVSFTRGLIKLDGTDTWTENELDGKFGPVAYCPVRDKFVLTQTSNQLNNIIGRPVGRTAGVWTVGNGVRYITDEINYEDLLTFDLTKNLRNIVIEKACWNNVFLGNITDFRLGGASTGNTVWGNMRVATIGPESYNNVLNDLNWSDIAKEYWNNINCNASTYFYPFDYSINNTFLFTSNFGFYMDHSYMWNSTVFTQGWGTFFEGNSIEQMYLFTTVGSSRANTHYRGEILNAFIGGFNADNMSFNKRIVSTSIFERPDVDTMTDSLNIELSPSPTGTIKVLAYDEKGNVIKTDILPISDITPGIGLSKTGSEIRLGDINNYVKVNTIDFMSPGFLEAIPTQTETFTVYMQEDTGLGARLWLGKDYDTSNTQLLKFNQDGTVTFNDDHLLTGIKYEQDYSANFTARSIIDKEYVDKAIRAFTSTAINYTVLATDKIVAATTGGITITLATSQVTNLGKEYKIDNASIGNIFIIGEGGELIQGQVSQTVPPDSCINVYSNGTGWRIC